MILVAIAAPLTIGIIEVRVARNARAETAAIEYLQAIAKAENAYRQINLRFSGNLGDLDNPPKPDPAYHFEYRQLSPASYILLASPVDPGRHGKRYFFMDQSGTVRYEVMRPAGPISPPVPGLSK